MTNLIERDLRLKGHVYFNKVDEGVYFQGQTGGFIVKGDKIYPLVSKIISFIDAGYRLQDIQGQLPEKIRPFFNSLMAQLDEHQMLVEREGEKLVPDVWLQNKAFCDFFTYLQENASEFTSLFPKWQKQKVLLIGEGYALKSAVEALANSGLNELTVVLTEGKLNSVTLPELKNALDYYKHQLPGFSYQLKTASEFGVTDNTSENPLALASFDYVLQCASELDSSLGAKALPIATDVPGCVAGVLFGQAVVSPLSSISKSGYSDLAEQLTHISQRSDIEFPKAGLSILGSIAGLNLVKGFFGIEAAGMRNYVYRVSRYLEVTRHPLLPAASGKDLVTGDESAQMLGDFQAEYEMPDDRELEKYEQVKLALSACFDSLLGFLDESVGDTIKQVPLFHAKMQVRFPTSLEVPAKIVMSCGLDASTAGLRAIAEALSMRTSINLGVSHQQVATDFEYESWSRKVAAIAIARSSGFIEYAQSMQVNFMLLDDEEMQLIIRFLMSAGYKKNALQLFWNTDYQSFVASISTLNDGDRVTTIAPTALEAIKACLCATYIRHQFLETELPSTSGAELILPESEQFDEFGEQLRQLSAVEMVTLPELEFVEGEKLLSSHGVFSGYAVLAEVKQGGAQ